MTESPGKSNHCRTDVPVLRVWYGVCYISSMRLHKKFYRVMFGATRFVRDFYHLEEACEYAEMLAMETGKDVVVWQVDPDALRKIDAFVPIFFYSGRLKNGSEDQNGTDVA